MSTTDNERLLQLLVDRATTGLGPREAEELAGLLARTPDTDADALDVAAAAVDLAAGVGTEPLPARLRARVLDDARSFAAPAPAATASPSRLTWTGWLAAAACLVVAAAAWWPARAPEPPPPPPTASALRDRLVAEAPDVVRVAWEATKDPAGAAVRGDVVWSDREQRGFMHFEGLAPNDPAAGQYQLWIFDATQDERTPIDGGVFDMTSSGEVVVPIDAKLRVSAPKLFAVTYERPGGVVVSKRERLVTLAKL